MGTWAAFSERAARELVPHWFCDDPTYICRNVGQHGEGPFIDIRYGNVPDAELNKLNDLSGDIDSTDGKRHMYGIISNLVLTRMPIVTVIHPEDEEPEPMKCTRVLEHLLGSSCLSAWTG